MEKLSLQLLSISLKPFLSVWHFWTLLHYPTQEIFTKDRKASTTILSNNDSSSCKGRRSTVGCLKLLFIICAMLHLRIDLTVVSSLIGCLPMNSKSTTLKNSRQQNCHKSWKLHIAEYQVNILTNLLLLYTAATTITPLIHTFKAIKCHINQYP